jgi:hypothetical protein
MMRVNLKKMDRGILIYIHQVNSTVPDGGYKRKSSITGTQTVYTVVCLPVWDFLTAKNHPTNWTPWSRTLPLKLKALELVNKFPAFYETQRFITAFTSAPCSNPDADHSSLSHFSMIHFNIMEEPYYILFLNDEHINEIYRRVTEWSRIKLKEGWKHTKEATDSCSWRLAIGCKKRCQVKGKWRTSSGTWRPAVWLDI